MFDADGCLRKYDNTKAIMREFFDLRLDRYCIRKTYLEAMLLAEATKLENQARFILEKIDGEIVIGECCGPYSVFLKTGKLINCTYFPSVYSVSSGLKKIIAPQVDKCRL